MLKKEVLIEQNSALHTNVGEHIGYELGARFIKDYFDKYQEGGSHFVGRNIIEKILNQPECIGMKIYNALDENNQKTLVFVGINKEGNQILEYSTINKSGELQKVEGLVSDRTGKEGWFENVF